MNKVSSEGANTDNDRADTNEADQAALPLLLTVIQNQENGSMDTMIENSV